MTQEEERAQLRAENQALREALGQAQELLEVAFWHASRELEKQKTLPAFVKANGVSSSFCVLGSPFVLFLSSNFLLPSMAHSRYARVFMEHDPGCLDLLIPFLREGITLWAYQKDWKVDTNESNGSVVRSCS